MDHADGEEQGARDEEAGEVFVEAGVEMLAPAGEGEKPEGEAARAVMLSPKGCAQFKC